MRSKMDEVITILDLCLTSQTCLEFLSFHYFQKKTLQNCCSRHKVNQAKTNMGGDYKRDKLR